MNYIRKSKRRHLVATSKRFLIYPYWTNIGLFTVIVILCLQLLSFSVYSLTNFFLQLNASKLIYTSILSLHFFKYFFVY